MDFSDAKKLKRFKAEESVNHDMRGEFHVWEDLESLDNFNPLKFKVGL